MLRPVLRGRHICIVGEHERSGVGKSGAKAIAQLLLHDAASVRIIFPPAEYKDLREWAQHADRAEIETAIKAAPPVTLRINITVQTRERHRRRKCAHIH